MRRIVYILMILLIKNNSEYVEKQQDHESKYCEKYRGKVLII